MKCPRCIELSLVSRIDFPEVAKWEGEFLKPEEFYDEDGNYHSHQKTTFKRFGLCTQAHDVTITEASECPMKDYGAGRTVVAADKV